MEHNNKLISPPEAETIFSLTIEKRSRQRLFYGGCFEGPCSSFKEFLKHAAGGGIIFFDFRGPSATPKLNKLASSVDSH